MPRELAEAATSASNATSAVQSPVRRPPAATSSAHAIASTSSAASHAAVGHQQAPPPPQQLATSSVFNACARLNRYALSNRGRITDTGLQHEFCLFWSRHTMADISDESENDESRRTTPSTSPRASLATPSSYGGDDFGQNHATLVANEAAETRSVDSGG